MSDKILIVEDHFIESNHLRMILEKAGNTVSGIAKSVEQAMELMEKERPDIVLLDIFLKTAMTGIHLARLLNTKNIPFIYLSANSNPSTFEAAKLTKPSGFLVKPYRENDLLMALDIASYRHRHEMDLLAKQGEWLNQLLDGIGRDAATSDQMLLLLIKAFRSVLSFSHVLVDIDSTNDSPASVAVFHRIAFDDYRSFEGWQVPETLKLTVAELNGWRKNREGGSGAWFGATDARSDDLVAGRFHDLYGEQSVLFLPISGKNQVQMSISFFSPEPDAYTQEHIELLTPLRPQVVTVLEKIRELRKSGAPGATRRGQTVADTGPRQAHDRIIGNSPRLLQVLDQVNIVAAVDTSVLVLGETGVGKEGVVEAIHKLSRRRNKPLIKVNCAGIPSSLIESELFGHERGAFTGAQERRIGKFEQAQGGTILLDEIGEMPLETQSKLLRVIQEKELERVGGRTTVRIDVRIIAATNRNLHREVAAGNFRVDLFYRINVFPIYLPPLRQRKEDIPLLAEHFLHEVAASTGRPVKTLTPEALQQLTAYSWPGNIRELRHQIERQMLMSQGAAIHEFDLPVEPGVPNKPDEYVPTKNEILRAQIIAALKKTNGKVSGRGGAAELLNIPATTLSSKMKRLGIVWQYVLE